MSQQFGLDYGSLESSEKRMVWYFFFLRASIDIILEEGAGIKLSDLLGEPKLTAEEAAYKKTVVCGKLDTPSFRRAWFEEGGFRKPFTMEMLAYNGTILGISVKGFKTNTLNEPDGIFLVPMNLFENINFTTGKKNSKVAKTVENFRQKFCLIKLLEKHGYSHLFKSLVESKAFAEPQIKKLNLTTKFSAQIAPVEQFYTVEHNL